MRKIVIILLFLTAKGGFCQLSETFSDNNFNESPVWIASNQDDFTIEQGVLRSNVTTTNTNFYVSTENVLSINCVWEFWVELKFNTSGANYVDIYLISDKSNLKAASINGYFLRIGGTDDEISLFKRTGAISSAIKIIDGLNGTTNASNTRVSIRVSRNESGEFRLEWNTAGTEGDFTAGGSVRDLTYTSGGWFGILVQQSTTTFTRKHYFDNIQIRSISTDSIPPMVTRLIPTDGNQLELVFSEDIEVSSAMMPSNYSLNNNFGVPKAINVLSSNTLRLIYDRPFSSGAYLLTISGVGDINGNIMEITERSFDYLAPYAAKRGDVVINEIFADPVPVLGLPDAEYVELWNTTSEYIILKNWSYGDATTQVALPADTLAPNSYAVLCAAADAIRFTGMGKVIPLTKWPSLNNDSDFLTLVTNDKVEVDRVAYHAAWYKDDTKSQGGYSLELIDPFSKCLGGQNWGGSKAIEGGTPGKLNSIYKEGYTDLRPQLQSLIVVDSITVRVLFTKPIDTNVALKPANYSMNNGVGSPITVKPIAPNYTSVELTFVPIRRGIQNLLTVSALTDCAGNIIDDEKSSAIVYIPNRLQAGDLLISEVLFNPKQGNVDFVEIYNPREVEINIQRLQLGNADVNGNPASLRSVAQKDIFVQPEQWLVLTSDIEAVKSAYYVAYPDNFQQLAMPTFVITKGSVLLYSEGNVIDRFDYNAGMHLPLLKDAKGVSLERRTFSRSANAPENFTSASATVGFATPTYRNSVSEDRTFLGDPFSLDSEVFSPDGDGVNDELKIMYEFPVANKIGSLHIYDDRGKLKRRLVNNHNLGTAGAVIWDGRDDAGFPCKIGIYILKLELFELTGKKKLYTKTVVLANRGTE